MLWETNPWAWKDQNKAWSSPLTLAESSTAQREIFIVQRIHKPIDVSVFPPLFIFIHSYLHAYIILGLVFETPTWSGEDEKNIFCYLKW